MTGIEVGAVLWGLVLKLGSDTVSRQIGSELNYSVRYPAGGHWRAAWSVGGGLTHLVTEVIHTECVRVGNSSVLFTLPLVSTADFRIRPQFESQLCHLLAVQIWARNFTIEK